MSGFSTSRGDDALRLDDEVCPHCGRPLEAEWVEFPPALKGKFGKEGEWDYHPCTPDCEARKERREWEAMRRNHRIEVLKERSGISKRLEHCTFDNFDAPAGSDARKAFAKVADYMTSWRENREAGKGLYFCGGVGTGKTHLAVALMNELIRTERVPSLFVTVPELMDSLRSGYQEPGGEIEEWMESVKNAEFLVMDDLGSERVTQWVRERMFVIINYRYSEALPTVFTSNTGPKDLAAQLGKRAASRMIEMCEWIPLEGPDHREMEAGGKG